MTINIRYRSADGFTLIPGPTEDLGQVAASLSDVVLTTPLKICLENAGDRAIGADPFLSVVLRRVAVGSNDGVGFIRTAADPNGTLSRPWGDDTLASVPTGAPTADLVGPYGTWTPGTYGVVATALNGTGETIASEEKTFTAGATDLWEYNINAVPGATLYRFYRTATPGTYGASTLVYEGPYTVFQDDGSAPSAGTPPEENTTGGAGPSYGSAPADGSFNTTDITIASAPNGLAVGRQFFFYLRLRLPAGASQVGNKRQGQVKPVELS